MQSVQAIWFPCTSVFIKQDRCWTWCKISAWSLKAVFRSGPGMNRNILPQSKGRQYIQQFCISFMHHDFIEFLNLNILTLAVKLLIWYFCFWYLKVIKAGLMFSRQQWSVPPQSMGVTLQLSVYTAVTVFTGKAQLLLISSSLFCLLKQNTAVSLKIYYIAPQTRLVINTGTRVTE